MQFCLPVELQFNNRSFTALMGPFSHSTEREFALAVSRNALKNCEDKEQLRAVAGNLLEGWAAMNTALQSMMKENFELRQALAVRDSSLEAADALLSEAAALVEKYEKQSRRAKWRLWPWHS
jgi:hypothetical protein